MRSSAAARIARRRGFTLLELLAVVFVVGILSSMLVVVAWPSDAAGADKEARRLAALFELALAEARANGQRIAWSPEGNGYSFWQRTEDGDWARFPDTSPYRRRSFGGTIELREVLVDARALQSGDRIVLLPYGFRSAIEMTIHGGGTQFILRGGVLGRISVQRIHAG